MQFNIIYAITQIACVTYYLQPVHDHFFFKYYVHLKLPVLRQTYVNRSIHLITANNII